MADKNATSASTMSKGVARGHVLCCIAVVFVCFMLTCLNLYMMSSTRSVLRSLDAHLEGRNVPPRFQVQSAPLQQLQQLQQQQPDALQQALEAELQAQLQAEGADDFILLAPGDLDNAWTTQTGRLLVPVGQPEEDDNGWKQMQVQLAAQTDAQQRHIENLHDKLADQYRAREELQRDQQDLIREHHQLAREHQRQMAKKNRQLLKEKHRVLKQGAKHEDEVRRYQSELDQLKQVVDAVQGIDATTSTEASPTAVMVEEIPTVQSNNATETVVEVALPISTDAADTTASTSSDSDVVNNPLDHIFSAVFGPNPGSFFFPSYSAGAEKQEDGVKDGVDEERSRVRRDLADDRKERRERRLSLLKSRLGSRRRRHDQDASGPLMRIDGGEMVPLETAAVVDRVQGRRRG